MESIRQNGINSIKGEIHSMLTLMRLNTRWSHAHSSKQSIRHDALNQDESPLVQSFRLLNEYLEGIYSLQDVDCVTYITPFYLVIISDQANGPLTCASLASLVKFASYGFLSSHFPNAKEGIALLANCITHCIFEETDWESDEVILMKLLELSTLTYRCDASCLLLVGAAWDIYSTCISIHSQYRASKILRSEAETALRHLTLTAFSRANDAMKIQNTSHGENGNILEDSNDFGLSQIMRDKSWDVASLNFMFDGSPVGVTLLLGKIMIVLSNLMDLQSQSIQGVTFALTLVNVALEAGGSSLGSIKPLVDILRGDICRHLLKASQSDDLAVFSLSLRVVFNLFMSLKDHMKIQLEVFLTSVHLRLLTSNSMLSTPREELALESLIEFCREPSLMQDLYTNYDCDVQCTNLFDSIVQTLCNRALPIGFRGSDRIRYFQDITDSLKPIDDHTDYLIVRNEILANSRSVNENISNDLLSKNLVSNDYNQSTSILNKLAWDGILSILHAWRLRCAACIESSSAHPSNLSNAVGRKGTNAHLLSNSECSAFSSVENLQSLTLVGSVGLGDQSSPPGTPVAKLSELILTHTKTPNKDSCNDYSSSLAPSPTTENIILSIESDGGTLEDRNSDDRDDPDFLLLARARTAEILRQRKLKKQRMRLVAETFNAKPMKVEWLKIAIDLGLINTLANNSPPLFSQVLKDPYARDEVFRIADPRAVARFLKSTPGLGKTQIGEFISKGPADLFPFHALVLKDYVNTFEFSGNNSIFDKALRLFLGHFRLPGEAQCIDRIMEAFAGSLYDTLGKGNPFNSADAAFILAFSTIMLNTDLHNPQIPSNKKMTKDQFVKNNRKINDGEDIPRAYLEALYDEIRARQIQVDSDFFSDPSHNMSNSIGAGGFERQLATVEHLTDMATWNKLINRRASQHAPAAFTPTVAAREEAIMSHHSSRSNQNTFYNIDTETAQRGSYFSKSCAESTHRSNSRSMLLLVSLVHEKDMFLVMMKPVLETLLFLWENTDDDDLLRKLIEGIWDYANICSFVNLDSVISVIIQMLALRSRLLINVTPNIVLRATDDIFNTSKIRDGTGSILLKKLDRSDISSLELLMGIKMESMFSLNDRICSKTGNSEILLRENCGSLEQIPNNQQRASTQSFRLTMWKNSCLVRGELMFKVLVHLAMKHPTVVSSGAWQAIIFLLCSVRDRGVLPPPLAIIEDVCYISNASMEETKSTIELRLPPSTFANRCFKVTKGLANINAPCFHSTYINEMMELHSCIPFYSLGTNLKSHSTLKSERLHVSKISGSSGQPSVWSWLWAPKNSDSSSDNFIDFDTSYEYSAGTEICSSTNMGMNLVNSNFGGSVVTSVKEFVNLLNKVRSSRVESPQSQLDGNTTQFVEDTGKIISDDLLRVGLWASRIDHLLIVSLKDAGIEVLRVVLRSFLIEVRIKIKNIVSFFTEAQKQKIRSPENGTIVETTKEATPLTTIGVTRDEVEVLPIKKSYELDIVMLLEWANTIYVNNLESFQSIWPIIFQDLFSFIFDENSVDMAIFVECCPFFVERCVVIIMAMIVRVLEKKTFPDTNVEDLIWSSMRLLRAIPAKLFPVLGDRVGAWIYAFVKLSSCKNRKYLFLGPPDDSDPNNMEKWLLIFHLMSASCSSSIGRIFVWDCLGYLIVENKIHENNFTPCRHLVLRFIYGVFPSNEDFPYNFNDHGNPFQSQPTSNFHKNPWTSSALMHLLHLTCMALAGYKSSGRDLKTGSDSVPIPRDDVIGSSRRFPLPPWSYIQDDSYHFIRKSYKSQPPYIIYTTTINSPQTSVGKTSYCQNLTKLGNDLPLSLSSETVVGGQPSHFASPTTCSEKSSPYTIQHLTPKGISSISAGGQKSSRMPICPTTPGIGESPYDYNYIDDEAAHSQNKGLSVGKIACYNPSNLLVSPLIFSNSRDEDVELLWLETCKTLADLSNVIPLNISKRASYCLQTLLLAGQISGLSSTNWSKVLDELLNRLSLSVTLSATKFTSLLPIDDVADLCLRSCNLTFDVFILHIKDLRQSTSDFHMYWLRFLSVLSSNLNSVSRGFPLFDETIEMISALLRLMKLPSYPQAASVLANQHPTTNSQTTDCSSSPLLSTTNTLSAQPCGPTNINGVGHAGNSPGIGFFGIFRMFSREADVALNYQDQAILPVQISSPDVRKSNDLAGNDNSKAFAQAHYTTLLLSDDSNDDTSLLCSTWKSITTVCPTLPSLLKSNNPQVVADILRVIEAVEIRNNSLCKSLTMANTRNQDCLIKRSTDMPYAHVTIPTTIISPPSKEQHLFDKSHEFIQSGKVDEQRIVSSARDREGKTIKLTQPQQGRSQYLNRIQIV